MTNMSDNADFGMGTIGIDSDAQLDRFINNNRDEGSEFNQFAAVLFQ